MDWRPFLGQNGPALEVRLSRIPFLVTVVCLGWASALMQAGQGAGQAAPAAPKPLVPAAANSIAANPDAFLGQIVTVTASIDQVVSPTSFTVDQDPRKPAAGDVLVIAKALNAPLILNSHVTVIGEVVRHEGRPAIRATSVLTAAGLDLAKRIPPPMTPEEEALDKAMKTINPAFGAIRQAVAAAGGENAVQHAATLKQAFIETEAFWKKRGVADAQKWAADARAQSEALERAIADGQWDAAKAAAGTLQQACSACHGAYRERLDDGTYRMRTEGK
jgi:hypothetical protein